MKNVMERHHRNSLEETDAHNMAKQKDGVMPISDNTALSDIQEVNLSYLMLAQRLLRDNYAAGMYRLGFDSDVADIVLGLSPPSSSSSPARTL